MVMLTTTGFYLRPDRETNIQVHELFGSDVNEAIQEFLLFFVVKATPRLLFDVWPDGPDCFT